MILLKQILVLLCVVCFAELVAEKVKIEQKSLTMHGLLIEAARQLNKIVLLEVDDPSLQKKYYDCEVEFDSVVGTYINYFKEKYGVTLVRSDREGILILGLTDEDRKRLQKLKMESAKPVFEFGREKRKSLMDRMFSLDKNSQEKPAPQPSIKKMVYPEEKEVERKTDHRMKIEILSDDPVELKSAGKKSKEKDSGLILFAPGPKIKKKSEKEELPNLESSLSSKKSAEDKDPQQKIKADKKEDKPSALPDLQ